MKFIIIIPVFLATILSTGFSIPLDDLNKNVDEYAKVFDICVNISDEVRGRVITKEIQNLIFDKKNDSDEYLIKMKKFSEVFEDILDDLNNDHMKDIYNEVINYTNKYKAKYWEGTEFELKPYSNPTEMRNFFKQLEEKLEQVSSGLIKDDLISEYNSFERVKMNFLNDLYPKISIFIQCYDEFLENWIKVINDIEI